VSARAALGKLLATGNPLDVLRGGSIDTVQPAWKVYVWVSSFTSNYSPTRMKLQPATIHLLATIFACYLPYGNRPCGIGANFPHAHSPKPFGAEGQDLIQDHTNYSELVETGTRKFAKLEQRLSATPHRAKQLREILKSEGRLTPKLAWQNQYPSFGHCTRRYVRFFTLKFQYFEDTLTAHPQKALLVLNYASERDDGSIFWRLESSWSLSLRTVGGRRS